MNARRTNAIWVHCLLCLCLFLVPNWARADCGNNNPQGTNAPPNGCNGGGTNYFAVYTGNVHRPITDLEIWGGVGEHQLVWERYGNSRFDYDGQRYFGWSHGWRHSYQWHMVDAGIKLFPDGGATKRLDVFYPDGTQTRFEAPCIKEADAQKYICGGTWTAAPSITDHLSQAGSFYLLQRPNGWRYAFEEILDAQGKTRYQLQWFTDSQQNQYTLTYNAEGDLDKVTEPGGRWLQVHYGNVPYTTDSSTALATIGSTPPSGWSEVTVSDAGSYRYLLYYGPLGGASKIAELELYEHGTNAKITGTPVGTGPAASPGHEYDKAVDGNTSTSFEFSNYYFGYAGIDLGPNQSKRVNKIRYYPVPGAESAMAGGVFIGTNTAPSYDRVITSVETNDGRSVTYQFSTISDTTLATEYVALTQANYDGPTAASYTYGASLAGTFPQMIHAVDPGYSGKAVDLKYEYASSSTGVTGRIFREKNGQTDAVTAERVANDATGKVSVSYGNGGTEIYSVPWDKAGTLAERTNALGATRHFDYSAGGIGLPTGSIDALGRETKSTPTAFGNPLMVVNADGTSRLWTRDDLDLALTEQDELGRTTTFARDARHRVTEIDYPDGSVETFSYNSFSQVVSHGLRNGGTETFSYDPTGLKTLWVDAEGNSTTYAYDAASRLSAVTDSNGHTTNLAYDERGHVTQITYADGSFRQLGYDDFGNKTSETDELGNTWLFTYDELRRLTAATDPLGRTTTYEYALPGGGCGACSAEDKPTKITTPSGRSIAMTYDLAWHETSRTQAPGTPEATTEQYAFDAVGNRTSKVDGMGRTWAFAYDARNRVTSETDPLGRTTSFAYDLVGNRTSEVRADGATTLDEYDTMNRRVRSVDAGGHETKWTFDEGGRLEGLQDAKGNKYGWDHDGRDRTTAAKYPDGSTELFAYDGAGNLLTFTARSGAVRTNAYDARNRETAAVWSDSTPATAWTYDAAGRTVTLSRGPSVLSYSYDAADQMISEEQLIAGAAPRVVSTGYDLDGRIQTLTHPSGDVEDHVYDARGQMKQVAYDAATLVTYAYDANGNRTSKSFGNGVLAAYGYSNANEVTTIAYSHGGSNLARFDYGYDIAGRRKYEQRDQQLGDVYGYDATDQLIHVQYGATDPAGIPSNPVKVSEYIYDATGNRQLVHDGATSTSYVTNALNQYTLAGPLPLAYDANGNLKSHEGWTYGYDAANHLVSAVRGNNVATFEFDGQDRCVRRTINGVATYLYYRGWNLIEERDAAGGVIASYVHGSRMDEMLARIDASGTSYHLHNALGSVIGLTDSSGGVVEKYAYDVFGAPTILDANGTVLLASAHGNRFLFTGREYLPEVGLYDYRHRAYSAKLGRFLQSDPIRFAADETNIYRYVRNNVTNRGDPLGLFSWGALGANILGGAAGAAVGVGVAALVPGPAGIILGAALGAGVAYVIIDWLSPSPC